MARSKSDISNSAIRIFLQDVGAFYDKARGHEPFGPRVGQLEELLAHFDYRCCYCASRIDKTTVSLDHLIPMNKAALGLHSWGNIVPCCRACNSKKQQTNWEKFLATSCEDDEFARRRERIAGFVASKKYDPNLDLHTFADNLYEDVGEVVMTLIRLRYKQAEDKIRAIVAVEK